MSDIEHDGCSRDPSWDHLTPAEAYGEGFTEGREVGRAEIKAQPVSEPTAEIDRLRKESAMLEQALKQIIYRYGACHAVLSKDIGAAKKVLAALQTGEGET